MNRNKYKNYVLQNLSSEHIMSNFIIKLSNASIELKFQIFYEIIITVLQFTRSSIENCSACHAWHACRRMPTPGLGLYVINVRMTYELWFETVCKEEIMT
jgi:hypothetical protein